jgi:predicted DCC family thiol-disulfide oxidoreductase YuxK
MRTARAGGLATKPILLFNEECGACRRIARWVRNAAPSKAGGVSILERPIGHDPKALHSLRSDLSIRKAHAALHVVMPDGTVKLDGEAVAEVLRHLPSTKWFAWIFSIGVAGFRPFQMLLNMAYAILVRVRPILAIGSPPLPPGAGTRVRGAQRKKPLKARHAPHSAAGAGQRSRS